MQFSYTIFYVNDVLATIRFYHDAFGIETKFVHESEQYAELDTGSTTLAMVSED